MESESTSKLQLRSTLGKNKEQLIDRIQGCIYGAALGDAFGLATEFMTKSTARHLYGVGPIKFGTAKGFEVWRDGHRTRWHEGDFTDDTDQLLLIVQCLIADKGELNPRHFAYRLREWTNLGFPELHKPPCGIGFTVGSVIAHPDFLENPFKASYDIWDRNRRNLAPNGAVMRTSVLGIPFFWDERKVVENAIRAAKVTHADPRSVVSSVIVSVIISRLLVDSESELTKLTETDQSKLTELFLQGTDFGTIENSQGVSSFIPKPKAEPPEAPPSGLWGKFQKFFQGKNDAPKFKFPEFQPTDRQRAETPATIPDIEHLSMDNLNPDSQMYERCLEVVNTYKFLLESSTFYNAVANPNWVQELESHCFPNSLAELELDNKQSMGYTFKCLGAGIYAVTRSKPKSQSDAEFFKDIITELTLEAGDADTNCAVAGALLGARLGKSGLPADWLNGLRNKPFLEEICTKLCSLVQNY